MRFQVSEYDSVSSVVHLKSSCHATESKAAASASYQFYLKILANMYNMSKSIIQKPKTILKPRRVLGSQAITY